MAFKFLILPTHDSQTAEAELNAFLRSHRIVSLTRRWVESGPASFWSFCIQYLDAAAPQSAPQRPAGKSADFRRPETSLNSTHFARQQLVIPGPIVQSVNSDISVT
jgi:hypothetical protein